jgi:RND family efflux transporter MFP subunit
MYKRKINYLLALVFLALGSALLPSCSSNKTEKELAKQENSIDTPLVVPILVQKGKLSTSITLPGELLPYQQVDIFAKINSYVKTLLVDVGSEVHQGQILATLDAPEINSQLAGAQSRIKQQEALYIGSKATYDRLLNTSKTPGTISENDLEQAEAKKNSDFANLEAAKSAYNEIAANLNYLEIRAPFNGVITKRNVNLGAYVGPGGKSADPLFVIQDQKRLRLVVSVPEINAVGLSNKTEISFSVASLPNQKFESKIVRLAGAVDEKLRSEFVEMDIYNNDKKLIPHMFAEVELPIASRDSAFILPKTAVVTSTEKVFVVKIVGERAVWVEVKKGFQNATLIEVYGSLKPGDHVVKVATDEIRDGSIVRE